MQMTACERDILNTACLIDFRLEYGLYTSKTSDAMDFGQPVLNKMAAINVRKLSLYPMQMTSNIHMAF